MRQPGGRAPAWARADRQGTIMLSVYVPHGASLDRIPVEPGKDVPDSAIWFDLITPTQEEDKLLERHLGIAVPTREEMQEIEVTSRLYVENGARYMTATLMCQSDTDTPKTTPVTFILSGHRLITVRYDDPKPFMIVGNKLARTCPATANGESVLMDLLDAVIDRAAYLTNKITFLLDAMLGVVSIEQNNVIKLFSVAAVVFMPPTLIASIYGMNFHRGMLELDWKFGYPFALFLMVVAAVLPYYFFRWKKWL